MKINSAFFWVSTAICACWLSEPALAQKSTVLRNVKYGISPPLRDIVPNSVDPEEEPVNPEPELWSAPVVTDPVVQMSAGGRLEIQDGMAFDGITSSAGPPDTNGAAGATQFVQWANSRFAVYDKATGDLLYGPASGSTLFQGMGCPCESDHGDGVILYDKAADRWLVSQLASPSRCGRPLAPTNVCIAISTTSDARDPWYQYQFNMLEVQPAPWFEDITVPDYPKFGVWPDGYYYTANAFAPGHNRTAICAFDRANMLVGNDATAQCFLATWGDVGASYLPADLDGSTPPPSGAPNYLVDLNSSVQELRLLKFHVDWADANNSTLTGPLHLSVAGFTRASGTIPQLGVSQQLETLGDRLMFRLAYRNFGDHEVLVANHSVQDPITTVKGVRWYEVRDPSDSPTVYQQGTFIPDSTNRWMGSIAMDQAGNIAIGYSASDAAIHPAIRYTGRTPSDPLGMMADEKTIVDGTGSQTATRWGDYSSLTIDPIDDCTFWYTTTYLVTNGNSKRTRIASFRFPDCG